VHRRDSLRGEKILHERLFKNPKIEVVWDTAVEEIMGTAEPKSVTGVRLKNVKTGAITAHKVDGVFIAIGHAPATELFAGQLEMTTGKYLITKPDSTATSIPGVFAAGDVKDETFRQAVTAAGMGCMAALESERYLAATAHAVKAAE
jgi:thioredoxin reductase (NADPH)